MSLAQHGEDSAIPTVPPAGDHHFVQNAVEAHDGASNPTKLAYGGDGAPNDGQDATERNGDVDASQELEVVRAEKAALEGQYRALLGKLTTMRNTLGDKLRQDADELDRREQQIASLQSQTEDLTLTVEALKSELIAANEESETVHAELEQLRSRALDSQRANADEFTEREEALREAREEAERLRDESDEWRREVMTETVRREQAETALNQVQASQAAVEAELASVAEERDRAVESAGNLQAVLEEFQAAKDEEIRSVVAERAQQLSQLERDVEDFRQRAKTAESQVQAARADNDRVMALSRELKEKNGIIGKLRHEGVILNEHLTEALRRLKKDSNEFNVDRRLVTNVLLSFITTPRGDAKRFEMLSLLATILSWTDDQREEVGLQKSTAPSGSTSGAKSAATSPAAPRVAMHRRGHTRSGARGKNLDDTLGENETFSSLWIEFLLREANPRPGQQGSPEPSSPTLRSAMAQSLQMTDIPMPPSPGSTLSLRSDTKEGGSEAG